MAFTLSHVAAVLPIPLLHRRLFLLAPLAIGSMTPDIPYFVDCLPANSHLWSQIFPFYLPLGFGLALLWYAVLRRPFYYWLPYFFAKKNPLLHADRLHKHLLGLVGMAMGVLIGIATHLIWDGLTHEDHRTFIFKDTLAAPISVAQLEMPLYRALQYASSLLGLAMAAGYLYLCYRQSPALRQPGHRTLMSRPYRLGLLLLCGGSGLYYAWDNAKSLAAAIQHGNDYLFMGQILVGFIQGSCGCFLLYAMAWHLWQLLARLPR